MISNRLGTIFANDENPFALNVLQDLVENLHTIRTDLTRDALHSRKNLNKECDWPDTGAITIGDYKEMYDRSPIAHRVVGFMPDESWQFFPRVFEDEDASISTDFEEAFSELGNLLSRTQSWHKGEDTANQIWEYLHRADKLSGIGHFGVILIGIDDGLPLDQPVAGFQDPVDDETPLNNPVFINNQREARKLLHLSVFSEFSVSTIEFENNNFSPRYRLPKFYHIDLGEVNTDYVASGREGRTIKVHWSRIVHIADNMDASEVLGVPRMRPVWNNLLDLMKIYGGDAEGYWKGCILNIFLESHPQLGGDVDMDESTIQERMWDMQNGLQRWAALTGLSAKTVAPTAADPKSHIDIQIDAICIKIGVPKRIFQGSERGELASSQDDGTWNDRLRGRRVNYLTPRVVVPFIDRLIQMGVLPEPKEYFIEWPDPETTTPQEKATVAQLRVDTMVKYIQGQVESLMNPLDFLTMELELSEDEAIGVLERALELAEAEQEAALELEPTEQPIETALPEEETEEPEEDLSEVESELATTIENLLVNVGGFKTDKQRKAFFARLGKTRAGKSSSGPGKRRGLGGRFISGGGTEAGVAKAGSATASGKQKTAETETEKQEPTKKKEEETAAPAVETTAPKTEAPKTETEASKDQKVEFEDRKKVRKFKEKDHQERIDQMNESTQKMTAKQRESIEDYTSGEIPYQELNKKLREGKKLNKTEQADLDRVNDAVKAAGDLPPGTKVYRGITLSEGDKAKLLEGAKKGKTMEMPGLTSTSIDPSVSGVFGSSKGGVVFEMAPKSGAYVSSLSGFDRSARKAGGLPENEVLLASGKKFKVVEVLEDVSFGKKVRKGFGQTVIQLEEI